MLLRAAIAGVIALLVLLCTACLVAPPVPTPEAPLRPADRPVAASGDAGHAGRRERVRVTGARAETVNLRAEPGMAGTRLKALVDGVQLELLGPDRTADGRFWRHVRDPSDGVEGRVSAEFLAPVTVP